MARSIEMQNPEVRKLWWITLIVQSILGFTSGLYLYTYGPYFYEKFGGGTNTSTAMVLTTVLLGVRQGLVALLEVPTGAFADAIGRVHVVILSWIMKILFFISLAAIWFCDTIGFAFMWGVIASIFFALSYTFFNGAFSAWCAETLREKAPNVTYGWLASRFYSYQSTAVAVGAAVAILFYLNGLAFVGFLLAAFLSFCAMGYSISKMDEAVSLQFLSLRQVQFSTITRRMGEIIGKGAQVCAKNPVLFWIVLSFGCYMFLLNLVIYLWPIFLKSTLGVDKKLGVEWVFIAVSAELLRTLSSRFLVWLNKRWTQKGGVQSHLTGFRRIFIGASVVSALSVLLLSWNTVYHQFDSFIFPEAVLIVILSYGVIAPCFESLVNAFIPPSEVQYRSTIMSAGSMFRSLLILVLAVPAGGTSGETTTVGWALPAGLLLIASIVANVFMKRAAKEKQLTSAVGALT